jgi:hypothetical protein
MKMKIAVATVNGRAYYQLVTELNRKRLPFLSAKPWDPISLQIKVVLTTEEESSQVTHPKILVFEQGSNPEAIVDEAVLIVQGKQGYERIVVGVDPGKTYGIAVLGDNKVLEALTSSNVEEVSNLVVSSLKRFPAKVRVVRVGNGPPEYTQSLLDLFEKALPEEILLEIVSEVGTSRPTNNFVNRRVLKDVVSAIKIAGRNGRVLVRKNVE